MKNLASTMFVIISLHWLLGEAGSVMVLSKLWTQMQEFEPRAKTSLISHPINLSQEWRLSFQFKPNNYTSGWANLLQVTIGGKKEKYGDRTPAIFFHKDRGMLVASAVNGKSSFQPQNGTEYWNLPEIGKWTWVEVGQKKVEMTNKINFYMSIEHVEVFSVLNTQPMSFSDVQVFLSNPWHLTQPGRVRNFLLEPRTKDYSGGAIFCPSIGETTSTTSTSFATSTTTTSGIMTENNSTDGNHFGIFSNPDCS